mmetsp:Transcript_139898/g.256769  ORF Transcript_139898/g.256769 Transcript_139898/m.256769 type:complete len:352 (+) Transcript_139898:72-1127(+)
MPSSSNGSLLLLIAICTWLMARSGENDGHPLCNGTTSNWPWILCWDTARGDKSYRCMWYTMEVLSGWPQEPRTPSLKCSDLHFDCESSYVCTVLLQYAGVGPAVSFGEDSDRAIAASCLRKHCPSQAALADGVIAGVPGLSCPHTHYVASNASREAAEHVGGDADKEQPTSDLSDLPRPPPAEHGEMKISHDATTTPDWSKAVKPCATTTPDLRLIEAAAGAADELTNDKDTATDAASVSEEKEADGQGVQFTDDGIDIFGSSWANTNESVNNSNDTVEMDTTGEPVQISTPTILSVCVAAALLAFCACPAAISRSRRQNAAREMLLPPSKPTAGEGERDAVLEAAVDDAE